MRSLVAAVVVAGLVATAGEASAFCKLMTCNEGDPDCNTNARGCVRDGVPVTWNKTTLPYRVYAKGSSKLDDDKLQEAIKAAFDAWQYVDCEDGRTSLRFEEGSPIREDKPKGLGAEDAEKRGVEPFGIYFRDDEWGYTGAGNELAKTGHSRGNRRGQISYADIEINTTQNFTLDDEAFTPGNYDFQTVLTHEVGHYLGLAHSDDGGSIMAPRYCDSSVSDRCTVDGMIGARALGTDDIKAVCTLYPHDVSAYYRSVQASSQIDRTTGGATAGCSSSGMTGKAPLWAFLPALAALLRRKKRSRVGL